MVGDCTGHGVPGAFMTLIAWGLLDRMLRGASEKPSQVLADCIAACKACLARTSGEATPTTASKPASASSIRRSGR